jgi:hypothetical protein
MGEKSMVLKPFLQGGPCLLFQTSLPFKTCESSEQFRKTTIPSRDLKFFEYSHELHVIRQ